MATLGIRGGSVEVAIDAGTIVAFGTRSRPIAASGTTLDATGCTVAAGFVDLQVNGGFGVDLAAEPERIDEVAVALPATGVTSFLPTVITAPVEATAHALAVLQRATGATPVGARSLGVHLEGPFLAPERRGAHRAEHLRPPSLREARSWTGVTMVTLAPEVPGALDVIADLAGRGVVVSVGHTAADAAVLDAAFAAGVTGATHLFNAMGPFGSREPATVGALLAHPTVICGLIADGRHVDPIMVTVAWRALGREQIALVTDAIAPLGTAPASGPAGEELTGGLVPMDQVVRNLVAFTGCCPADAAHAASATPARLLRRPDLGRLAPGCVGDVVLLDADGAVAATVVGGAIVHDPDGRRSG